MADAAEVRKAFEKFDHDGDGFITAKEFHQAMADLGDVHYTESMAQAVINAKDGNADGKLSFDEFLEIHTGAR